MIYATNAPLIFAYENSICNYPHPLQNCAYNRCFSDQEKRASYLYWRGEEAISVSKIRTPHSKKRASQVESPEEAGLTGALERYLREMEQRLQAHAARIES